MMRKIDRVEKPYCLTKLRLAENAYLPLNRKYKPLGVTDGAWVDYDKYAAQHGYYTANLDLERLPIWWNTAGHLYLYSDDPNSRAHYDERVYGMYACLTFVPGTDA